MWFPAWLRNRKRHGCPRKRPVCRPTLETLEARWVPSTLTVTTTADSGPGSLRADIAAAHKGDTINFAPSLVGQTITLTSGELLIKQNLTITGPGASQLTISGDKLSRVFELSSKTKPTVSISGLTLDNGVGIFAAGSSNTDDGEGGAIRNEGTLTISNSILSGNAAPAGGAINNDGTLTVIGCTLTGNSAPGGNGQGGAIANFGTLTLSASTLSHNSALYGGGIANYGTATVNAGTTLSDNSGTHGGGIYTTSGTVAGLTIDGCTLSGNTAVNGGGIFDSAGTLTVRDSTVTSNSASVDGGGLYNTGTLYVTNGSHVTGNSAPSGADLYNLGRLQVSGDSTVGVIGP
jgi:hypothetical protein